MRTSSLAMIIGLSVVAGLYVQQLSSQSNQQQQPPAVSVSQETQTQAQLIESPGTHFAAAMEVLLASTTETHYQHRTEIDEANGIVNCDCSGLVGYMLRQHFPESYRALEGQEAGWRKRPLAVTFYESFHAAPEESQQSEWVQVKRLSEVVPGDLIAWRKKNIVRGKSTGHVLMVAGYPEVLKNATVRLKTIESTSSGTRKGFQSRSKTFTTDSAGQATGYLTQGKPRKALIAIGRLNGQSN